MAYRVLRSKDSTKDLALIFEHLVESYVQLGDVAETALERAAARIRSIEDEMEALGRAPRQGTLLPDLLPGLRRVTKSRAIFYFTLDEQAEELRVLAVFFGGQDHQRHMLKRL